MPRDFRAPIMALALCASFGLGLSGPARAGEIPPCGPGPELPVSLSTYPRCPQPGETVFLIAASPCDACVDLQEIVQDTSGIRVRSTSGPLGNCPLILCAQGDTLVHSIGVFTAGHFQVRVTLDNLVTNDSTGASCQVIETRWLEFSVGDSCPPPPPPPADSLEFVDQVVIGNGGVVCADQVFPVHLSGTITNDCFEFFRLEILNNLGLPPDSRRVAAVFRRTKCPPATCLPASTPWFATGFLAGLPPGTYQLPVSTVELNTCGGDSSMTLTGTQQITFTLADTCPPPPPPPPPIIYCEDPPTLPIGIQILPRCPQPGDSLYLRAVSPCAACLDLQSIGFEYTVGWVVRSTSGPIEFCNRIKCIQADVLTVPIGRFAAGHHVITVVKHNVVTDSSGAQCLIRETHAIPFDVGLGCPPPGDSLYGIDRVAIGVPPCNTCPPVACAGRDIPVRIAGTLESDCVQFRRIEVYPPPPGVVGAPALRVVFAQQPCLGIPCQIGQFPWQSGVVIDALPAGTYSLPVHSVMRTYGCNGDSTEVELGMRVFTFTVQDTCDQPPTGQCLTLAWAPGNGDVCNARVGPGRPAKLQLGMKATTPIAGFQGKLFLTPYGLHIESIRAINAAAGMRVLWNPWPGGASFVLFSDDGRLLPSCNPLIDCINCCGLHSVLEVTVAVDDSTAFAPVTELLVWEVIGADSSGNGVYTCVRTVEDRGLMAALICADKPCDANGDGATDVRDLVKMVNCLNSPGSCPADSAGSSLDCQRDGDFDLDDVLCCAHFLLHGQMPDSAETVPAPQVRVRFGTPIATATGIDVPARIEGAGGISAARLGLDLPAEIFDLSGVTVSGGEAQDWLALHEQRNGEFAAGLIRLATSPRIPEAPDELVFTIHLTLLSGKTAAGQLWLVDGDFTGREGEGLIPGASDRSVQLGSAQGVHELALARPQPNPFSREATLSLSLEREADVELTVHDLTGRLVTTVHHGRLAAGPHSFTWRGARGDGTPAANGVYFVRAKVGGRVLSQKVALLRGR